MQMAKWIGKSPRVLNFQEELGKGKRKAFFQKEEYILVVQSQMISHKHKFK